MPYKDPVVVICAMASVPKFLKNILITQREKKTIQ
jgi:hypothetical protein